MTSHAVICAAMLAVPLAAQGPSSVDRLVITGGEAVRVSNPDAPESLVVTLPGVPAPPPKPATVVPPPPDAAAPAESAPGDSDDDHRPLLRRAPKPILPAEFERESAVFTQRMIGAWTQPDAYNLFGEPLRERPVFDGDGAVSGRVLAYSDPTGRYREIELDFAKDSGVLRTVFVYPWKMSWQECRRLWGANVHSTQANKGRTFYSYVNRRLDVLVDAKGNVISFGLY